MSLKIHIDRGGTFTDAIATFTDKSREPIAIKLLSEDPSNYKDAPLEAIRQILEKATGKLFPRNEPLDTSSIYHIRCGTTVATNALLERKGERCAFITTKGFKDALIIGTQARPNIFELDIKRPEVLYSKVVEINERVTLEDFVEDPSNTKTKIDGNDPDLVIGRSGEVVRILKRIDENEVRLALKGLRDEGFQSLAVCFAHSFTYPEHENIVGRIAKELGFEHVSLSAQLMPMIKFVSRANSATADAYLSPVVQKYISGFAAGLEHGIAKSDRSGTGTGSGTRCEFMQSDGGLIDVSMFSGLRAILSGPAGGVVGYSLTSYDDRTKIPVIGFDMGGTSTDVSRFGGEYELVFETTTAGITIQSPQLDINTVAAGGGSRLFWKNGLFNVGPESAGAHPGPVCYRKNGYLAVTDANLVLGRLLPESFPNIFGPNENEPLDYEAAFHALSEVTKQVNAETNANMTVDQVAYGFIKIANELMARPIRALTEAKGHDVSKHRLASFGGAGGQHCVAVAQSLGIHQVLIHKYSSMLSAYGMALADVIAEVQKPTSEKLEKNSIPVFQQQFSELQQEARGTLKKQGFSDEQIGYTLYLNCRYEGTESAIMIRKPNESWDFLGAFLAQHKQEYGFLFEGRDVVVDDLRVRATGKSESLDEESVDSQLESLKFHTLSTDAADEMRSVYFEGGRRETPVYYMKNLQAGSKINGPCMVVDNTQTIVVPPNCTVLSLKTHTVINVEKEKTNELAIDGIIDPIYLSIFGSRFMAVAEQMGYTLQKTSVSTNVKERLDYSCAIFDADGGLVANAPHLPVHLGSMSTCVRTQAELHKGTLKQGDVLVTNHPSYGGTHLPDITTITPHFHNGKIVFYVASRAHHADIGGLLPGSMPPSSKELAEEGARIKSDKVVIEGNFNEKRMIELLQDEPATIEGCSGTRCLTHNLNDLRAQVAANQKGINLIGSLFAEYGEPVVLKYMRAIQENAENAVRQLLMKVKERFKGQDLHAEDFMDDGTRIALRISIDGETGDADFDFTGTSEEVYGNTNAPMAITYSAIIYVLRALISESIPLNQGCLKPVKVHIPENSLLCPSETAAVVGGNVLTSQRITDVILRAFQACAASQGDMNNLTFGIGGKDPETGEVKPGFGYYETICGGSGACNGSDGVSGVHTHMTNTRITDLEVLERRYPVILHQFSLRPNSGGKGQWIGGDGVIRDIEFRIPLMVSILSERRVYHPYGLKGGEPAERGKNIWLRNRKLSNGELSVRRINLGGKNTCNMMPGDHFIIYTPGGGGFGPATKRKESMQQSGGVDACRANGSIKIRQGAQLTN
ncbi:oxoprolinase [Schizosaccharomyces japonicus yFS275]|uniref:Oxoprolinase n=1 Tax=Schizosaccharomyces japonicus (strain yFS275 / FY16936) TaxID=402676 RepID=B6JZF7_SCHJY|nr:oxoprolinase [Schizosaccharomyces japonicus yFS275]EEB06925.1 oxoprolinase [Schizosaccharomyces japonicus yFS275]